MSMRPSFWQKSGIILLAFAIVVAVTYAQRHAFSGNLETLIRSIADKIGLFGIPVLIALAYRAWVKHARSILPSWRNCLGLSSIVILSAGWLFIASLVILGILSPGATRFFGIEWTATLLYSSLLAGLLAFSLKGISRPEAIAASLLMWAWMQSWISF